MVKPLISWYSLGEKVGDYLTNVVAVPKEIRLEGEEITWNPQNPEFSTKAVNEDLVFDFANLVLVGPESILEFAQKWGVLGFCEHGLPATHSRALVSSSGAATNSTCQPTGKESVSQWQEYARRMRAMIKVATNVNKGELGGSEDWLVLGVEVMNQPKDVSASVTLIDNIANGLFDVADVRPRIQVNPAKIKISHPASSSLFGLLAIRLAQTVVRTHGPFICSSCGKFYRLGVYVKRPRAGERNYCTSCGRYAANRDASRVYRRRLKEEKQKAT